MKNANVKEIYLIYFFAVEKNDDEKNTRFFRDFKTLADVVVQESIKYHIGKDFPMIEIRGEENNIFENTLGESVTIHITDDKEATKSKLLKVLDGNEAASDLCDLIYEDVEVEEKFPPLENEVLDFSQIGN